MAMRRNEAEFRNLANAGLMEAIAPAQHFAYMTSGSGQPVRYPIL